MKKIVLLLLVLSTNVVVAQYTLIPDAEFELRLITQGIDTEGTLDGQVLTDDIDHIVVLDVSTLFPEIDPTISDLTGIEDFISLEFLNFGSNTVEQVDLSSNTNLKTLVCKFNNLTSIDVSNNLLLEVLDLTNCFPGTCDQENTFTTINLSNNSNLKTFFSFFSFFEVLDFSNNPQLESLTVNNSSTLTSLNIKNGSNIGLSLFDAMENPNLTCITVDDPIAAGNASTPPYDAWNIDVGITFSENCSLSVIDNTAENYINAYPNPADDVVFIDMYNTDIMQFKIFNSLGVLILEEKTSSQQIDISSLHSGVFMLQLETTIGPHIIRFIKK